MNRPDFIPCPDCKMRGSCTAVRHCAGPVKSDAARTEENSRADALALIAELADALGAFTAPFDGDSAEVIELETGPATAARVVAGRAILAKVRAA